MKGLGRPRIQGARWRRLDNTATLFAAVAGEDLSNVFRLSAVLKDEIQAEILEAALKRTLPEFEHFRVKLRKGFFWSYFETNNHEPLIEKEDSFPCKFIDPHVSHRFPFRVSYYGRRINLEVFHGLADGLGALNFLKRLTEYYIKILAEQSQNQSRLKENSDSECLECGHRPEETSAAVPSEARAGNLDHSAVEDGYLKHYKKRAHRRYVSDAAMQLKGQLLPLDWQSVLHGSIELDSFKNLCRKEGVSITKYLTAALMWSIIQVYTDGKDLKRPVALNVPVNLRSFFPSETMANFFAVTNIAWPAGKPPERFEQVLAEVSRQMDENIVKEKLEETISYNVSMEKKWYLRLVPLPIKNLALNKIFLKSSKAYTMTLSNLGLLELDENLMQSVEEFQAMIGVSKRQRLKCTVIAYHGRLNISFNSAMTDTKLQDFFFQFLEEKGVEAKLESNGVVERRYYKGTYPEINYDRGHLRKFVNLFYFILFTAAAVTGLVNLLTFEAVRTWWSLISIGGIAYVAMTLRYSIMRRASLAGILVRQSLGIQLLLILIDYMTGFRAWSVNYAIPSVILFDVIAILFLIVVNRLNWQSYFMYQLAITLFSFIPIVFWILGWLTSPFMSVLTVVLSVAALVVTVILGDRSVKNELKRRFYF